jgi:hypothetical protein
MVLLMVVEQKENESSHSWENKAYNNIIYIDLEAKKSFKIPPRFLAEVV